MTITTKRISGSALLAAGLLVLGLVPAQVANANETAAVVTTDTEVSEACLEAVAEAQEAGDTTTSTSICEMTTTLTVSPEVVVTPQEVLAARSSLSASDFEALQTAAAAGTVRSKSFTQSFNNIVDGVSQSGVFYYNGSRVWVTQTYLGYTGHHSCKTDWAVGYVVESKKCDESGTTAIRDLRAIWHFSVIPSGGLVNWDEEKHLYVDAVGVIW